MRDDPAAEGIDAVECGVVERMASAEAQNLDLPHVVRVKDQYVAHADVYGPFESALDATVFAERLVQELLYEPCVDPVETIVAPLLPP
jgi:hypothetical protein